MIGRVQKIQCRDMMAVILSLCAAGAVSGTAFADSLWTQEAERAGSLYSDKQVEYHVGDIIMVMVSETTDAVTTAQTDTEKTSELSAEATAPFLTDAEGLNAFKNGLLPNWDLKGENTFESDGTTRRKNTLTTVVSVRVTEVLASGNVRVEGNKVVIVNRERTTIRVKGILRPEDVTARNTVLSSQLAEGQITIEGHGPLWNMQRRGILTRFLDWIWPF